MDFGVLPRDDHYLYGTALRQPYPAYYNNMWYHRPPPRRFLSDMLWFYDDGSYYILDNKPADPSSPVVRSARVAGIVNIETVLCRSLRIKLYGVKEEDDVDLTLELGKGYSVTYITEGGLKVAKGVLKVIDSSIPDTCVRYIGEFNETTITSWIGLDCSTTGNSDKRKIFIASIRAIEEVSDDPDYQAPEVNPEDMSYTQRLTYLINSIPDIKKALNKILCKVRDNDQIMTKLKNIEENELADIMIQDLETGETYKLDGEDEQSNSSPTDSNSDQSGSTSSESNCECGCRDNHKPHNQQQQQPTPEEPAAPLIIEKPDSGTSDVNHEPD